MSRENPSSHKMLWCSRGTGAEPVVPPNSPTGMTTRAHNHERDAAENDIGIPGLTSAGTVISQ